MVTGVPRKGFAFQGMLKPCGESNNSNNSNNSNTSNNSNSSNSEGTPLSVSIQTLVGTQFRSRTLIQDSLDAKREPG